MKKAKMVVLFVALAICLCVAGFIIYVNSNKITGFQPPIKGISWGMTSDEVIKKLNLSQDCVTEKENGDITISYENTSVFNRKANVQMSFDVVGKVNLYSMGIEFPDSNKDDLINQLNHTYGQYVVMENNQYPIWESEKIKELPQKIQDRFKYQQIELLAKYNIATGFSEDTVWKSIQNKSLVSVELIDSSLSYSAANMAVSTILSDDEKYNAWITYYEDLLKNSPNKDAAG